MESSTSLLRVVPPIYRTPAQTIQISQHAISDPTFETSGGFRMLDMTQFHAEGYTRDCHCLAVKSNLPR